MSISWVWWFHRWMKLYAQSRAASPSTDTETSCLGAEMHQMGEGSTGRIPIGRSDS
jgi:hypothetical protein